MLFAFSSWFFVYLRATLLRCYISILVLFLGVYIKLESVHFEALNILIYKKKRLKMAVNSETNSTPEYWQNVWDKGDTFFHKPENHP